MLPTIFGHITDKEGRILWSKAKQPSELKKDLDQLFD